MTALFIRHCVLLSSVLLYCSNIALFLTVSSLRSSVTLSISGSGCHHVFLSAFHLRLMIGTLSSSHLSPFSFLFFGSFVLYSVLPPIILSSYNFCPSVILSPYIFLSFNNFVLHNLFLHGLFLLLSCPPVILSSRYRVLPLSCPPVILSSGHFVLSSSSVILIPFRLKS